MEESPDYGGRSQTLRGRVERVTYSSTETGYAVLRIKPVRGGLFTATGHVAELADNAGLDGIEFDFIGNWGMTRYGRQFAFTDCKMIGSELLFFLSKVVKGLGEKMSHKLVEEFGEKELVNILDNNPEKLLDVKGIKKKRLALITKSWQKHKNLRDLAEYLGSSSGITPNLLVRIYNHFEDDSLEVVKNNPYRLTEIRGIGFKRADSVALSLGLALDSEERINAAISHVLVEAAESDGHCFLFENQIEGRLDDLLSSGDYRSDPEKSRAVTSAMILSGKLVTDSEGRIGLSSYKFMEDWLRGFFKERSQECSRNIISDEKVYEFIEKYEDRIGFELADEQKAIVKKVAIEPRMVFGLAGYAGTGKTTICAAVLDLLSIHYADRDDIVCCAFTGMASSRLRKTTGYEAFTIHSLLKYKGDNQFEYGPENPLPHRVVVLDEASMVSLPLFYRLAKALKPTTLLILVGDPAQLPPIGAGNVFADLLEKRLVPSVHLEKIYRQSQESVLTLFANEIRLGKVPEGANEQDWLDFRFESLEKHNIWAAKRENLPEKELRRLREENNQAILDRILHIVKQKAGSLTHPVWDFQVLTPMRVGQLGTEVFNRELQAILNPEGTGQSINRAGIKLQEKDKVVHLQNRDMEYMAWNDFVKAGKEFRADGTRRIFNGNTGLIMKLDREAEQFYVVYPERIVIAYDFDHIGDIIELAYALTVHKAQGSQYKLVAIPMTNSHFIMLNSKWFYTAITRAEEKVYLVGQDYAFKRACTNVEGVRRQTWLGVNEIL